MNTTKLLYSRATQKLILRDKVIQALKKETEVPAFQATTSKLLDILNRPDLHVDDVAEIVKLDPGIASHLLKIASSPSFSSNQISSIQDALMIIGMSEVRNLATSILLINRFEHLRIKVDWNLFWLHSVLTARLTERFAAAYRPITGKEYLAGLLHDIGKLYLEHYFPKEFELVILLSAISNQGMYHAEKQLMDINHAEVSSLLCSEWHLNDEIVRAIHFHHEPEHEGNMDAENSEEGPFLALCINIADKISNLCHANIQGGENLEDVDLQSLPEWKRLKKFAPQKTLILDVASELKKAEEIISSVVGSSPHVAAV
jgi:putative nucleotidyltransferase with HDIG domain